MISNLIFNTRFQRTESDASSEKHGFHQANPNRSRKRVDENEFYSPQYDSSDSQSRASIKGSIVAKFGRQIQCRILQNVQGILIYVHKFRFE